MKLTVFAKKGQTKDNSRTFYNYITTLKKKDGTEETVQVKFREECGAPKPDYCPIVIEVDKKNANRVSKKVPVTDKDGIEKEVTRVTLWVTSYIESEEKYVDHSLDDYED